MGRRVDMKNAGALCLFCKSHDVRFDGGAVDGRPKFKCGSCGNWWTCGHRGGPWIEHCDDPKERLTPDQYRTIAALLAKAAWIRTEGSNNPNSITWRPVGWVSGNVPADLERRAQLIREGTNKEVLVEKS